MAANAIALIILLTAINFMNNIFDRIGYTPGLQSERFLCDAERRQGLQKKTEPVAGFNCQPLQSLLHNSALINLTSE
jgi:hypothetical protein